MSGNTTRGLFKLTWLDEAAAHEEAARISHNFSLRYRNAYTEVLRGDGGYITLQGNHQIGKRIEWDGEALVVVAVYAQGRKISD